MMQLLWDRGEGNGYAHTMNSADRPLPNTPPHNVLLRVALGDHQVANITAEVEARTIGAKLYTPTFRPGRSWAGQCFGIPTFRRRWPTAATPSSTTTVDPTGYTCPTRTLRRSAAARARSPRRSRTCRRVPNGATEATRTATRAAASTASTREHRSSWQRCPGLHQPAGLLLEQLGRKRRAVASPAIRT